jgi:hypothetical protein
MAARYGARAPGRGYGFFKVIRFSRSVRSAESSLRYVAFGSRDLEKGRSIFDERSDHADVNRFVKQIPDHVTRHPQAAKSYHCLFSLRREDFDRSGMGDWKGLVRDVMRTYELETKRKLQWIASEHHNEKHPHCHVIIKAVYTDQAGNRRQFRLNRWELQRIKEITGRHLEARGITLERAQHRPPVRDPAARFTDVVGTVLSWLQRQIAQDHQRRRREEEEHMRRLLREAEERDR